MPILSAAARRIATGPTIAELCVQSRESSTKVVRIIPDKGQRGV